MNSMNNLPNNLNAIMKRKRVKVKDIVEATGISRFTIYKILSGKSKNPIAAHLKLISQALDVSVDSLLDEKSELKVNNELTDAEANTYLQAYSKLKVNNELNDTEVNTYLQASIVTLNLLIEKNKKLSLNRIAALIEEVYEYSIKSNLPSVDEKFIRWLIDKNH